VSPETVLNGDAICYVYFSFTRPIVMQTEKSKEHLYDLDLDNLINIVVVGERLGKLYVSV